MLKNPPSLFDRDPFLSFMSGMGAGQGKDVVNDLPEGFITILHHNPDFVVWGGNSPTFYQGYPEIFIKGKGYADLDESSGVCDSPQQFIDRYADGLRSDPRQLSVFFTHVPKNPGNAGLGGGWRWSKWGQYLGDGKKTTEYLDDEKEFPDGVWCFQILQLDEKPMKIVDGVLIVNKDQKWIL